jgi:hypothetical protein
MFAALALIVGALCLRRARRVVIPPAYVWDRGVSDHRRILDTLPPDIRAALEST